LPGKLQGRKGRTAIIGRIEKRAKNWTFYMMGREGGGEIAPFPKTISMSDQASLKLVQDIDSSGRVVLTSVLGKMVQEICTYYLRLLPESIVLRREGRWVFVRFGVSSSGVQALDAE
jgi:hypothetical protein